MSFLKTLYFHPRDRKILHPLDLKAIAWIAFLHRNKPYPFYSYVLQTTHSLNTIESKLPLFLNLKIFIVPRYGHFILLPHFN